jgi:hypothetical protein
MIPNDQGSAGQLWLRGDEIEWSDVFQHPLRGPHCEGLSPIFEFARIETVLFSFEGSDPHVPLTDLRKMPARVIVSKVDTSILENCIEKNFHVPNMKSGPPAEGGCNFE